MIILFILISFSYYQVYIISINTKNTNIRQVLGFNILYSLFLPFITIQMARSIVVVWSNGNSLKLSSNERVMIVITLYFVIGSALMYFLKDVYFGLSVAYNLFSVFVVQIWNVCMNYYEYCDVKVQIFSFVYALVVLFLLIFILVFYPKAYRYQFEKRNKS